MGKRVLLADDSATIQRAFAMVFGAQADVSLVAARSLDEALSAARNPGARPDLVIADATLGNRTGYELCAAVKSDPGLRGVPVFILASNHTPYDEAKGRDAGADGHLLKPFESQGLIDKVNDALARSAAPGPARDVHLGATPAAARPAARPVAADESDDEYGEFKIERSSGAAPIPAAIRPAPAPAPMAASAHLGGAGSSGAARPAAVPSFPPAPGGPAPGLRPSLIPGARPGMVPGRVPIPTGTPAPVASARPPAPAAQVPAPAGRTIMGLPAVAIPGMAPRAPAPGSAPTPGMSAPTPGMPAARPVPPARPAPAPATPVAASSSAPAPTPAQARPPIDIGAAISARVEQKMTSISARGPEYEAIAKLSREVIEQVVWEVVPELAEVIIREHVERLASSRK